MFIFMFSCKKDPPLYQVNNLNGNKISVFGHAGMGVAFKYPIDTYESIEPVLRIGADGSEMDIQMTRDSVLVLFHEEFLQERLVCTSGMVNDKNWDEIANCQIASPYSSNIRMISFDNLMNKLTNSGKNIHDYTYTFDCKLYSNATDKIPFLYQYARAITRAAEQFGIKENILVESQDTTFLRIVKNQCPELKLFIYHNEFNKALEIAQLMNLYGITMDNDLLKASEVKKAHEQGFRVTLWGVYKNSDNISAIEKSPDFIQTDKPIHLLKIFNQYKKE
jgi:glycerophosphoryl diester phosphodiesterase